MRGEATIRRVLGSHDMKVKVPDRTPARAERRRSFIRDCANAARRSFIGVCNVYVRMLQVLGLGVVIIATPLVSANIAQAHFFRPAFGFHNNVFFSPFFRSFFRSFFFPRAFIGPPAYYTLPTVYHGLRLS
jgi:hypothetical protein